VKILNSFKMPKHPPSDRDPGVFFDFMARVIPDAGDRESVIDWMAARIQEPQYRNYALVLLSETKGTGKGTFWSFIEALWPKLSTEGVFTRVFEQGYQDDLIGKMFVLFDEVSFHNNRRNTRQALMNNLQRIVQPQINAPSHMHRFGSSMRPEVLAASFVITTNHINALPIATDDRRFHVIQFNEVPIENHYGRELEVWRRDPANIAALWHALAARDLSGFSGVWAPNSSAKQRMTAANRSWEQELADSFYEELLEWGGGYTPAVLRRWLERQNAEGVFKLVHTILTESGRAVSAKKIKIDGQSQLLWVADQRQDLATSARDARRFLAHLCGAETTSEDI
jgi:hypothetical protein